MFPGRGYGDPGLGLRRLLGAGLAYQVGVGLETFDGFEQLLDLHDRIFAKSKWRQEILPWARRFEVERRLAYYLAAKSCPSWFPPAERKRLRRKAKQILSWPIHVLNRSQRLPGSNPDYLRIDAQSRMVGTPSSWST